MKLCSWSTAFHQEPEGVPDEESLLLDRSLVGGFAASEAWSTYENRLWCGTAVASSAGFCTWELFPASLGITSVLKNKNKQKPTKQQQQKKQSRGVRLGLS